MSSLGTSSIGERSRSSRRGTSDTTSEVSELDLEDGELNIRSINHRNKSPKFILHVFNLGDVKKNWGLILSEWLAKPQTALEEW